MKVPFLDLKAQNAALKQEILPIWGELLEEAEFIGGPQVSAFEEEFAALLGSGHCVAVGSGTDALRFALLALGLAPGDEVITAPNSFIATSEAISQAGGRVVFADVDPLSYNLDPERVAAAITPRTRAIVPVHLYGQTAEMDAIGAIAKRHGLCVVEDACQAHLATHRGRMAGTMGGAAAFSFYPGKNLGACGEAGAVTTNDSALAARMRMLRNHGQNEKYYHQIEGYNGRCDALQAAALRVKLKHLPDWCRARRQHAELYCRLLAGVPRIKLPQVVPGNEHVFHLFVVQVANRERVKAEMAERGVECGLHYPLPLHLQRAYADRGWQEGDYPVAEAGSRRLLSLPIYAELSPEAISYVCQMLKEVVDEHN